MRNSTETDPQPPRLLGRWERVRVVCAWCDQTIANAEPARGRLISHGLCEACAKRLSVSATPRP